MNRGEKAVVLRELHHRDTPVVFVNARDGASARILESAGFPAIATTRPGVAYVDDYPTDSDRGTYGFLSDRIAHADLNTLLAR